MTVKFSSSFRLAKPAVLIIRCNAVGGFDKCNIEPKILTDLILLHFEFQKYAVMTMSVEGNQ